MLRFILTCILVLCFVPSGHAQCPGGVCYGPAPSSYSYQPAPMSYSYRSEVSSSYSEPVRLSAGVLGGGAGAYSYRSQSSSYSVPMAAQAPASSCYAQSYGSSSSYSVRSESYSDTTFLEPIPGSYREIIIRNDRPVLPYRERLIIEYRPRRPIRRVFERVAGP